MAHRRPPQWKDRLRTSLNGYVEEFSLRSLLQTLTENVLRDRPDDVTEYLLTYLYEYRSKILEEREQIEVVPDPVYAHVAKSVAAGAHEHSHDPAEGTSASASPPKAGDCFFDDVQQVDSPRSGGDPSPRGKDGVKIGARSQNGLLRPTSSFTLTGSHEPGLLDKLADTPKKKDIEVIYETSKVDPSLPEPKGPTIADINYSISDDEKRTRAARYIQHWYRGENQRHQLRACWQSVITQKLEFRSRLKNRKNERLRKAAQTLQANFRGFKVRKEAKMAALTCQIMQQKNDFKARLEAKKSNRSMKASSGPE